MPNIKLSDNLNLELTIEPAQFSGIARYFRNDVLAKFLNLRLGNGLALPLDQLPFENLSTGISFAQPITLDQGAVRLNIRAGLTGSLALFKPGDHPFPNLYGQPVAVPADHYWMALGLTASAGGAGGGGAASLNFGMEAGGTATLTHYVSFSRQNTASGGVYPSLQEALKISFGSLVVPGSVTDVRQLQPDSSVTVAGTGKLRFSAEFNLQGMVNPLATLELPQAIGTLKVAAGASVTVGASVSLAAEFQLRIRKLGPQTIELGYYRKKGSQFDFAVTAQAGVGATVGKFDVWKALNKLLGNQVNLSEPALLAGGLTAAQVTELEKIIQAGIEKRLELALRYEFSALTSTQAAFLYRIQLDQLDGAGEAALEKALGGDLVAFTLNPLPVGVTLVRSLTSELQRQTHQFKINLLGVYNFISVAEFTREGTFLVEPISGEFTISDRITASRVRATLAGVADSNKLRRVLLESFLLTAAYHGASFVVQAPELQIFHSYFEFKDRTNRQAMKDNLDVVQVLGLLTGQEKEELLGETSEFGQTTFWIENRYNQDAATRTFLAGERPRSQEEYEKVGLMALQLLVQKGDPNEFRRVPATNLALWHTMKAQGQFNLSSIQEIKNLQLSTVQLNQMVTDFVAIMWWADAMHTTAQKLAQIRLFVAQNPGIASTNHAFLRLRDELAAHLLSVAKNTHELFGDPWGLVAMDLVSGHVAQAEALLVSPQFMIAKKRF